MLLEFGFRNFFSFKEGASISFRLPKNCPEKISQGQDVTNILCVKGKNGSGKTNVLRAFSFLTDFASNSFQEKPEKPIYVASFYHSPEPTEFYVEYRMMGTEYKYELVVTKSNVVKEVLSRKKQKWVKVLERTENAFTYVHSDYKAVDSFKLRSNASFISTAHQYDLNGLLDLESAYTFFNCTLTNVSFLGLRQEDPNSTSMDYITEHYHKNPEIFDFVKNIITECDTGVVDIEIVERKNDDEDIRYVPYFIHDVDGQRQKLSHYTESSGTKSLYMQLGKYALVSSLGGIMSLDEFDINLHPHILPKLIEIFTDKTINVGDGQFFFTTHNNEILDLLGRYRTYLVEKEDNESFVYRLDEIPGDILRNDRPITPAYQQGKLGGIPRI